MKRICWEYKVLHFDDIDNKLERDWRKKKLMALKGEDENERPWKVFEDGLNCLGEEGWELVLHNEETEWYTFRRRKRME